MNDDTKKLPTAEETLALESADELAVEALSQQTTNSTQTAADADEASSDDLADTLQHLQSVIERNATQLTKIANEIKEKRDSMKSVFENDQQLAEVQDQVESISQQGRERKAQLQSNPQVVSLKNSIAELSQEKKEIEETISNHLINFYAMTQSKSFDTSDGDQWEFDIRAKVKPRRS
ncbi:MAG: hypothetical protein WDZ94_03590 [Patescibacteria group bacterium]